MTERLLDPQPTTFYDPLYEVVVFSTLASERGPRATFWTSPKEGGEEPDDDTEVGIEVWSKQFLPILHTYEFNRLNYLKQAGLAWLVFPSATHSRFSHALGCWLLSEWAGETVLVSEPIPGKKKNQQRSLARLGEKLREVEMLEEFQLALLLHDIGHFPFSHVIENNDVLLAKYAAKNGDVVLDHESIGRELIQGGGKVCAMFREYTRKKLGEVEDERFLSEALKKFSGVNAGNILYILDPRSCALPREMSHKKSLLLAVHELVSGVIDLDRLDHYHRDSHFMGVHLGQFNVRGLLHHMMLTSEDVEEGGAMKIQLFGDGIDHAFQMLYAKTSLTQAVFNNECNLAYEVMLNHAINLHWQEAEKDITLEDFQLFLPFYDDSELLHTLLQSPCLEAANIVQRIYLRRPFYCVGKFVIPSDVYAKLGNSKENRRASFADVLYQQFQVLNLNRICQQIFVRLDKHFGRFESETDWMDVREILSDSKTPQGCCVPLAQLEDHGKFVEFLRQRDQVAARTFWMFASEADPSLITRSRGALEAAIQVVAPGHTREPIASVLTDKLIE